MQALWGAGPRITRMNADHEKPRLPSAGGFVSLSFKERACLRAPQRRRRRASAVSAKPAATAA